MPRYLAPQERNCMLHLGPSPKQTMSGGLSGGLGTCFGRFAAGACSDGFVVSGSVVSCASTEITRKKRSEITIQPTKVRDINSLDRKSTRLNSSHLGISYA